MKLEGGTGQFRYQMEMWEGDIRCCVIDSLSTVSKKNIFKAKNTFETHYNKLN
jgi:hypothetical protein